MEWKTTKELEVLPTTLNIRRHFEFQAEQSTWRNSFFNMDMFCSWTCYQKNFFTIVTYLFITIVLYLYQYRYQNKSIIHNKYTILPLRVLFRYNNIMVWSWMTKQLSVTIVTDLYLSIHVYIFIKVLKYNTQ